MTRPRTSPSRRIARSLAVLCLSALALLAAGCGGEEADGGPVAGDRLTVYSSMPLEGPDSAAALDVVRGQQLALRQQGGRVGRYTIRLVSLDAATREADRWDPKQISDNARRAASDPEAIAYVGEFHAVSSAVSIPRLNEAGVLVVSPMDTAEELTARNLAVPGSPEKFFPKAATFGRTFARLVPSDRVQALAQMRYMEEEGVRRVVLLADEDPAGTTYATAIRAGARERGIAIVGREEVDPHEQDPRELVARIVAANPDAVFYAGAAHEGIVRLWQDLAVADPRLKLFAPGSLVDAPFIDAIGAASARAYVTRPVLGLRAYPPAARRFARQFERVYGRAPLPEALYGYEAMNAVLTAIDVAERAVGDAPLDRADVIRAFRATRREGTVLGDWELLRSGDTSLRRFGAYRVAGGELRYVRPLDG